MSKISKTTFTFTVLHRTDDDPEDRMYAYDGPFDNALGYAMRESWDGHMVGAEGEVLTVEVPDEEVPGELRQLGNDGEFFNDDLDGELE